MKTLLTVVFVALLAFLTWPYYQLWRLDQAVAQGRARALAGLVDLGAVQDQIRRRVNKEADSLVGEVSNAFVAWLQEGITRKGADAVEQLVTLDWMRDRLRAKVPPGEPGFLSQVSFAFFEAPDQFSVRVGELGADPVHLRLSLQAGTWRVTTFYH